MKLDESYVTFDIEKHEKRKKIKTNKSSTFFRIHKVEPK